VLIFGQERQHFQQGVKNVELTLDNIDVSDEKFKDGKADIVLHIHHIFHILLNM